MNGKYNVFSKSNNRRTFLKQSSIEVAGLSFGIFGMAGCSSQLGTSDGLNRRIYPQRDISRVSFVIGNDTRDATYRSLKPLEKEIEKAIQNKQVVIKANVGQIAKEWPLQASDANQLRGILDFLKTIYDKQVIIAEGTAAAPTSAGPINTFMGYENYGYLQLRKEYNVKFIDLNDEPTVPRMIKAGIGHPQSINLINTYLDPNVYLISATRFKPSGGVIVTLSLKNIVMGAPINHYKQKKANGRNEKHKMHAKLPGIKGTYFKGLHYNIYHVARTGVVPDLAVLDGIVAMEGDGPIQGTPVEHGVALASTDWLSADRLAAELMGVDYSELKYLNWCGQAGLGQQDLSKIKVIGPDYRQHIIKYKLNRNYEFQREWIYEDAEKLLKEPI